MKYIDLHVHSNVSDGTYTPAEVVKRAVKNHLSAFALTDHDTVGGTDEALFQAEKFRNEGIEIRVVPGVEISVSYRGSDVHILGLLIDHKNPELVKSLEDAVAKRELRNEKMAEKLSGAGIDISLEKLKEADPGSVITRAHFAKYLAANGYVKSVSDAFKKYLNPDRPYFVPREYMKPEKAIGLIKAAGGVPVLAHPLLYHYPLSEVDIMAKLFKEYGLAGIEAIYHANTGFDESHVKKIARKYGLLITGGSDFHGLNKPNIDIGVGQGNLKIPYELLEKLDEFALRSKQD